MNLFRLSSSLALLVCATSLGYAAGDAAKGQQLAQVCAACHGVDGNSPLPANPSLAGQHADYIAKQLKNFKSGERKNAIMAPMVASLSEDDMKNVAAYFANQTPRGGATKDVASVETGRKIFRGGVTSSGVAACAGCHSPNGAGIPAQYPRIAGQHVEYTTAQLKAFRSGERANDPNNMMRSVAAKLSDGEIDALARYVNALK